MILVRRLQESGGPRVGLRKKQADYVGSAEVQPQPSPWGALECEQSTDCPTFKRSLASCTISVID